ncbi:MAG: VOC family protein [Candidatus Bathyarchaeota archaeon]|nr:VOC family protein [Candidatus Bathyarchaeota archaeon]
MSKVIHFEIPADNMERAVAFYKTVFGWKIEKWGGPVNYWLVTTGEDSEPGINGAIAAKDNIHPTTINTVSVPSIDEAAKRIRQTGGEVLMPKMAVPGVGYMTYCKDPEGNIFGIMQMDPQAK